MNVHKNARTMPHLRAFFVGQVNESGLTPQEVAASCGVSTRTVYKWLRRYREEGTAGLQGRSSRPQRLRLPTPPETEARVEALRRQRQPCWKIAAATGISRATAARICKRKGLSRLSALQAKPPNGVSFRSYRYAKALRMLKIKHKRTRPYTPKTNGKAERFVQTSLREWAYLKPYNHSDDRAKAPLPFLHHYNYHRPHMGINGKTPISRIPVNNLLRHDN